MPSKADGSRKFRATVTLADGGHTYLPLPFDPVRVWGARDRYHVTGSIDGLSIRGPVDKTRDGWAISLGPAWLRSCGLEPGAQVKVELRLEGPQRDELAPDIVAALADEPDAAAFFDSLATFYRKGYLRWIDATKRRPDVRAQRIAEMIELLNAGRKQRPGT